MVEPKAASTVDAEAALREPGVWDKLYGFARMRCWRDEDAEDLLSEALSRVFDPADMPWKPSERPFVRHVGAVIRLLAKTRNRRLSTRNEIYDGGEAEESRAADQDGPEEAVSRTREVDTERSLFGRLQVAMHDDPDALAYLDLVLKVDLEPVKQPAALGWTPERWRSVVKRVTYRARIIKSEWLASEERRMAAMTSDVAVEGGGAA
jgi:hypothetical protein